jgi:hypothetical protein
LEILLVLFRILTEAVAAAHQPLVAHLLLVLLAQEVTVLHLLFLVHL